MRSGTRSNTTLPDLRILLQVPHKPIARNRLIGQFVSARTSRPRRSASSERLDQLAVDTLRELQHHRRSLNRSSRPKANDPPNGDQPGNPAGEDDRSIADLTNENSLGIADQPITDHQQVNGGDQNDQIDMAARTELKLPEDLRQWRDHVDAWVEMLTELSVQPALMKFYLYNAIANSTQSALLEPLLSSKGLNFEQYKTKLFETLDTLLDDEISILYNPTQPEPMRAFYIAVKNQPNATERQILKAIERHLTEHTYSILAANVSSTTTIIQTVRRSWTN